MNSRARLTHLRGWDGSLNEIPRPEQPSLKSAPKDTKRWCRGKVGTEHSYVWTQDPSQYRSLAETIRYERHCAGCGRRDWPGCRGRVGWFGARADEFKCVCGNHVPPEVMDALHMEAKREHYARRYGGT